MLGLESKYSEHVSVLYILSPGTQKEMDMDDFVKEKQYLLVSSEQDCCVMIMPVA